MFPLQECAETPFRASATDFQPTPFFSDPIVPCPFPGRCLPFTSSSEASTLLTFTLLPSTYHRTTPAQSACHTPLKCTGPTLLAPCLRRQEGSLRHVVDRATGVGGVCDQRRRRHPADQQRADRVAERLCVRLRPCRVLGRWCQRRGLCDRPVDWRLSGGVLGAAGIDGLQSAAEAELCRRPAATGRWLGHGLRRLRHGSHSADLSPDGKALYVADIGRNAIFAFSVDPRDGTLTLGEKHVSPRSHDGPRHVWPHPGGKYVYSLQEHSSMVDVFEVVTPGPKLQHVQGVRIIPETETHEDFLGRRGADQLVGRRQAQVPLRVHPGTGKDEEGLRGGFPTIGGWQDRWRRERERASWSVGYVADSDVWRVGKCHTARPDGRWDRVHRFDRLGGGPRHGVELGWSGVQRSRQGQSGRGRGPSYCCLAMTGTCYIKTLCYLIFGSV